MAPNTFTVKHFITETKDDINSPTTSTFSANIGACKQMVNSIEENLDLDRNGLSKMRKAIKAIYNGGCADSENLLYLSEALEKLGVNCSNREKDDFLGAAFVKFSFIIKEMSALEKTLMQNINNIIMFPLDSVLKGDIKGVRSELKKPVDKSLKEYDIKMSKIEKEKKAQAKEAGLIRTEISGAEIAEEMDRERKQLQYQMCDYLIKVNDIESKKSFDLLFHFIEYFNAQCKYFRGGLEAIENFQSYITELCVQLQQLRQRKEDEKRELNELKSLLKSSCQLSDMSSWSINNSLNSSSGGGGSGGGGVGGGNLAGTITGGGMGSVVSGCTGGTASGGGNFGDLNESVRKSCIYSLHQLEGNKSYGCYKMGYLLKKSESKMRVKVWQKRKCEVKDGFIYIWHSDESKPPTKVNLLTCQIKTFVPQHQQSLTSSTSSATVDGGGGSGSGSGGGGGEQQDNRNSIISNHNNSNNNKNYNLYFDLISCNRTYHFQVEDEHDVDAWISVLINSKDGALKREFDSVTTSAATTLNTNNSQQQCVSSQQRINNSYGGTGGGAQCQSLHELQQSLIEQIRKLPGNDCCVDCGSSKDPTWLSINFGVLTCIECSGIHREMGVHISRIQSLTLDNVGISQLLIARMMSNSGFNDILEASCNVRAQKPRSTATMDERNLYIRAKYIHKRYIIRTCTSDAELMVDLEQAVNTKDIYFLLQVWAEGANFSSPLPSNALAETALHCAIMNEFGDGASLHIVDFLVQNSSNLNATTVPDGNTALHYCVIYNRSECMKLLLRSNADYKIKNSEGKTPLDMAKEEQNAILIELLEFAAQNKKSLFENVILDFSFQPDDPTTDFSDDDIDDKNWMLTPEEMSMIRRHSNNSSSTPVSMLANGANQPNVGGSGGGQPNRFRSSARKISFKYPPDSLVAADGYQNDQVCTFRPTSRGHHNNNDIRPSSVIGGIGVITTTTATATATSTTTDQQPLHHHTLIIDNNNGQQQQQHGGGGGGGLSSFRSSTNSVTVTTTINGGCGGGNSNNVDESMINFIRGNGNTSRNSGRNRLRLSAGLESTILPSSTTTTEPPGTTTTTKSIVLDGNGTKFGNTSSSAATNRAAFISGHSRAASADITSGIYATVASYGGGGGGGKQTLQHNISSTNVQLQQQPQSNTKLEQLKPTKQTRIYHHVRNNSVDNSLVTANYNHHQTTSLSPSSLQQQQSTITGGNVKSGVITTTSSSSSSSTTAKPAIPVKPSGIVSVFVPGQSSLSSTVSNNNNHSNLTHNIITNKSTGNIYGKLNPNSVNSSSLCSSSNSSSSRMPTFSNHTVMVTSCGPDFGGGGGQSHSPVHHPSNSIHPVPPPRKKPQDSPSNNATTRYRRCVALYDCDADRSDELSFKVGEVILIINEITNDEDWMEGMIENEPNRRGLFPAIFVEFVS